MIATTAIVVPAVFAQTQGSVSSMTTLKKEAEKEISQIKGQIGENQKAITENLATLKRLDGEIEGSQKEIDLAKTHIQTLTGKIASLEKSISQGEGQLARLREEYLKAVKKMRVARKKTSGMAFIFASKSFAQAERRMRYMKEFSEWKSRQQDAITMQVEKLKTERDQLATARKDKDVAYKRQIAAQDQLKKQQAQQTEVVAQLKANGDRLQAHLARKQAEARQLGAQISQLIAQEQAKEAERKRKAAEEKAKAEAEKAKAQAEKAKAEAEKTKATPVAKENKQPAKETKPTVKETKKTSSPPAQSAADNSSKSSGSEESNQSRRRRRRDPQGTASQPSTGTSSAASDSKPTATGFGAMKGNLPRPVAGNFKIVSAFGKHPVSPELPDIMYENLGIDAHVATGATASSVFDGEVVTVYDRKHIPGFRNIVVVKHGNYVTVYANLETVAVEAGQSVRQGQTLGTVGADFDDPAHGLIHFEVWEGQSRLNPSSWIK